MSIFFAATCRGIIQYKTAQLRQVMIIFAFSCLQRTHGDARKTVISSIRVSANDSSVAEISRRLRREE